MSGREGGCCRTLWWSQPCCMTSVTCCMASRKISPNTAWTLATRRPELPGCPSGSILMLSSPCGSTSPLSATCVPSILATFKVCPALLSRASLCRAVRSQLKKPARSKRCRITRRPHSSVDGTMRRRFRGSRCQAWNNTVHAYARQRRPFLRWAKERSPSCSCDELTEIALRLRERVALGPRQRYRLVGLGLSNFRKPGQDAAQPALCE